jgi:hypothetical protein
MITLDNIPLFMLVNFLCRWEGVAYLEYTTETERAFVDQIKSKDSNEEIVHIEILHKGEVLPTGSVRPKDLAAIWKVEEWKAEYQRQCKLKLVSERNRQLRFIRDALIDAIQDDLGIEFPAAKHIAEKVMRDKNLSAAKHWGIEKIEMSDEEVGSLMLELGDSKDSVEKALQK